jgi:hypothetical protein
MKAVDIVTIEKLIPIYKNGEPANAIEVARVKDSEGVSIQYDIIVGKGLHQVGGRGIYIQPDYTIPINKLFVEYHAPFGDPKNSKLGKKGRVRAIKFNLSFEGSEDPIYSYGVLLPWAEFEKWFVGELKKEDGSLRSLDLPVNMVKFDEAVARNADKEHPTLEDRDKAFFDVLHFDNPEDPFPFQEILGVEKYVADDNLDGSQPAGMTERDFPSFLYKTDEETIQNHRKEVDRAYEAKEELGFTIKRDGSSITEYCRINPIADQILAAENTEEFGICSRKHEKKLDQQYVAAYKDGEVVLHKYFHPELKVKGWFNDETRTFYTEEEAAQFEPVIEEQRDAWIDTDKKYGYLEKLIAYCRAKVQQLVLRGELIGAGNKGSGNKLNSDARTEARVVWFGVDDLSQGFSRRNHYGKEHNLVAVCEELGFEYTKEVLCGVFSYDEIIAAAHAIFKKIKDETGVIVEGVVIRTKFSNNLSVKYINPEYDAKS